MSATHGREASETSLLAAVARGDQSAFERLYALYEKRLFHYICTLVFDGQLAEEIVGDTMMAVWRAAGAFSGASRVSTWIFGIARHKSLDAIRRSGRRQQEVDIGGAEDLPSPDKHPTEGIYRDEVARMTQRALSSLTREHQEILRLVFYDELPYEEIAKLLAIPENTVKTRVFYAKQRLKEHLERSGQKDLI